MLKRLAYKIVYDDLTKPSGCGLFVGKHDARNGTDSFIYGIWTVMEYIADQVSEKNGDKFNELFYDNLEKSEQKAKSRYGLQTDCSWK